MARDMINGFLRVFHYLNGENIVEKLGIKIGLSGRRTADQSVCLPIAAQFHRRLSGRQAIFYQTTA